MPYKRRTPVSDKEMHKERYKGHHTVCETLREIYLEAEVISKNSLFGNSEYLESIMYKARLATSMAKAMHEKLKKYKEATK